MFLYSRKTLATLVLGLLLAPAFVSAATFERPLEKGMSGADVSALQTILNGKGFFNADITGYFGPVTERAVADFQASVGLESLGYVGPATRALLNGEAAPVSSSLLSTLISQLQQLLRNAGYYMVSLTGTLDQVTLEAAQSISSGTHTAPVRSGGKPQQNAEEEEEVAVPDTAVPVISVISSGTPGQTSATITWSTDEPATTVLNYGPTSSYGTASTSAGLSTLHTILLSGLTASTTYHFQVRSVDATGNVGTSSDLVFRTAAEPETWARSSALVDLDYENDRFYVNGTYYDTEAAMVSAGIYSQAGGFRSLPNISTWWTGGARLVVQSEFTTTSTTPATEQYVYSFDDGDDATLGDELIRLGYLSSPSRVLRHSASTVSSAIAALDLSTVGTSTRASTVGFYQTNDFRAARNGDTALLTDTVGNLPAGLVRMVIGDSFLVNRTWAGTVHRVTVYQDSYTTSQLLTMAERDSTYSGLAYSWWIQPQTITRAGYTYSTGMRSVNGDQVVYRIDNSTKKIDSLGVVYSGYPVDDHSAPAINFDSSGRLMALYTGHGEDGNLRFRISSNSSPVNFGSEIIISAATSASSTNDLSYSQLFSDDSGNLYAISQQGNKYWELFKSADSGGTWTRKKRLFFGGDGAAPQQAQWYISTTKVGNTLRFYAISHPNNPNNVLYTAYLDMASGSLYSGGVNLGNIDSGTEDTEIATISTELASLRTAAADRAQRLLDVSDDGTKVLIVDMADNGPGDPSDARYYLGTLTGSNIDNSADWTFNQITTAGVSFATNDPKTYFGGAKFVRDSTTGTGVYLSKEDAGVWTIELWNTSNNGSSWSSSVLTSSSKLKLIRPVTPINAQSSLKLLWQESGKYDDFTDWSINTRW